MTRRTVASSANMTGSGTVDRLTVAADRLRPAAFRTGSRASSRSMTVLADLGVVVAGSWDRSVTWTRPSGAVNTRCCGIGHGAVNPVRAIRSRSSAHRRRIVSSYSATVSGWAAAPPAVDANGGVAGLGEQVEWRCEGHGHTRQVCGRHRFGPRSRFAPAPHT